MEIHNLTAHIPPIETSSVDYSLPPDRIAQHPLPVRDESKLLYADARTGTIRHHIFYELPSLLPQGAFVIRNTTRVLPARILATKPTGGSVEILLIAPADGLTIEQALASGESIWECLLGGRRIHPGMELNALHNSKGIRAEVISFEDMVAHVAIECIPPETILADQLQFLGQLPLPPYIRRTPTEEDLKRYQTVYAQRSGSVAAPTAGLHFTERVLAALHAQGTPIVDVVLHVGIGTFQPLRADVASSHTMHAERIYVERSSIEQIHALVHEGDRMCVCVGTTSVRTVETLYWVGVKLINGINCSRLLIAQEEPYAPPLSNSVVSPADALEAVLDWLDQRNMVALEGETQLYIVPGYRYRIAQAMLTNFHQPRSTLLLLVAAFIGPWWRTIYAEALANGYRFLSYGDASLLIANPESEDDTTRR